MPKDIKEKYDIIIIGGGVAGLSVANSLKNLGLQILLIERKPGFIDVNRGDTLYPHTLDIFEKWNVLEKLQNKNAVKSECIDFYKDGKSLRLDIISKDRLRNNFLLSLEHQKIEESLAEALEPYSNIKIFQGINVLGLISSDNVYSGVKFNFEGQEYIVNAECFIACDGRDSFLRKNSGIQYDTKEFNQSIVILNSNRPTLYDNNPTFLFGANHDFILAPLPENRTRVSLIVKKDESSKWMMMSDEDINLAIREESEFFRDCYITKSQSHIYEITMSLAEKFSEKNLIFIGDSAHTVHPISGQGMALAVSDSEILSEIIKETRDRLIMPTAYDYIGLGLLYHEARHDLIKKLQDEVSYLGDFLISQDRTLGISRLFLLNMAETIPEFERQIESVLQSEVEKF